MIHIQVDLKPVPKARPRFLKFSNRVYTPQKTLSFERVIALKAKELISNPIQGAVEIKIIFHFIRAKSNKSKLHIIRPDLDNLAKGVMDGLNKVAFKDDSQVIKLVCEKKYSDKECVEIFLSEIT